MSKRRHDDRRQLRSRFLARFQLQFLFITFIYFACGFGIFAAIVFFTLILRLDDGTLTLAQRGALADQFLYLHARFWPAIVLVFMLIGIHSLVTSHRFAGPLSRIRGALRAITSGDLTDRVQIRRNDYLDEEVEALNDALQALDRKIGAIATDAAAARRSLDALERALASGDDTGERINELRQRLDDVGRRTGDFRLSSAGGGDRADR